MFPVPVVVRSIFSPAVISFVFKSVSIALRTTEPETAEACTESAPTLIALSVCPISPAAALKTTSPEAVIACPSID